MGKTILIRLTDEQYDTLTKKKRKVNLTWLELLYNSLDIKY